MNRGLRRAGLFVAGLSWACPGFSWGASDESLLRRIIVCSETATREQCMALAQETGGKLVRELEFIHAVVVELPFAQAESLKDRFKGRRELRRIDNDERRNWLLDARPITAQAPALSPAASMEQVKDDALLWPRLPRFRFPWPPKKRRSTEQVPWGIARVRASAAWPVTRGQGVKVVVIDTGIDYKHPDLRVAGGWNAIDKKHPKNFMDDNGHGTHVSGTIAAKDNKIGVIGVAPKVELYGVKVLDAEGSGTFDDVIAGMQWAVQNHMQIASMSLGAEEGNESLQEAVAAMAKAGVVLVAAAGNSGGPVGYPAAYPGAIAVAASSFENDRDGVAYFSSRGPEVALIAPGVDVLSLIPDNGLQRMSGTSMATPHVSGLAALAIAAKGLKGWEKVRRALMDAATPFPDVPAKEQGAGMVDAGKLVR